MIIIKNKRCSKDKILSEYPDAIIIDVTSKAPDGFVRLSPFYPIGDIPIPGMNLTSASVEGIWQGLKTFASKGIDYSCFRNTTMRNLKRTVASNGRCLGHKYGNELLGYVDARINIYIPSYNWVLENKCQDLVKLIKLMSQKHPVVLLDYDTNPNVYDTRTPLSHASLIKTYIENKM